MILILVAVCLAVALSCTARIIPGPPAYRSLKIDAFVCFEEAFPYRMAMQTAATGIAPPRWFPDQVYTDYQLNPDDPAGIHRTRQLSGCFQLPFNVIPSAFRWGIHTGLPDYCTGHGGEVVERQTTQILSFIATNPALHPYRVSYVVPVRVHLDNKPSMEIPWYERCGFGFFDFPNTPFVCNSRTEQSQFMLYTALRPYALASSCAPFSGGHHAAPGRIGAYTIYYASGTTLYPGGPPYDLSVYGTGTRHWHGLIIQDMPRANEYRWMTITPVEPVEHYPWLPGEQPPYPPGSEHDFLFSGPTTYEIPCIVRNTEQEQIPPPHPLIRPAFLNRIYRWQAQEIIDEETPSLFSEKFVAANKDTLPHVPRGARAIVAYSSNDPRPGWLPWYSHNNHYEDYWLGPTSMGSIVENLWRYYHGVTETNRAVWNEDPLQRGWGVAEYAFVHGWFTQECSWHYCGSDVEPPRWSAWYCGGVQLRITGGGDINVTEFRNWILSRPTGFGILFEPLHAACNDVLSGCAGQPNALGEHDHPDHATQVSSSWNPAPPTQPVPTPCQQRGMTSKSFRWFDNSPCSPINKGPHCGLYHPIRRKKFQNPEYTDYTEEIGWAKLTFTSTPPQIVVV